MHQPEIEQIGEELYFVTSQSGCPPAAGPNFCRRLMFLCSFRARQELEKRCGPADSFLSIRSSFDSLQ
jgi:hypothetical protein